MGGDSSRVFGIIMTELFLIDSEAALNGLQGSARRDGEYVPPVCAPCDRQTLVLSTFLLAPPVVRAVQLNGGNGYTDKREKNFLVRSETPATAVPTENPQTMLARLDALDADSSCRVGFSRCEEPSISRKLGN